MESRRVIEKFLISKCSSKAFIVKKGQVLRVVAHEGKQVADIRFINANDYREQFSGCQSVAINKAEGIGGIKKIKKLYSKLPWANIMLTAIDDKVGNHTFGGQCSRKTAKLRGQESLQNCADLFDECLKPYGLSMKDLDSAGVFNVFMPILQLNDENGSYEFVRPSCEQGDYIDFLAEMDVLVAATSCPCSNIINDYEPKAMKYEIRITSF